MILPGRPARFDVMKHSFDYSDFGDIYSSPLRRHFDNAVVNLGQPPFDRPPGTRVLVEGFSLMWRELDFECQSFNVLLWHCIASLQ